MDSTSGPSSRPAATRFPRAALRVIAANKHEKAPCYVPLAISHRLFWIPLENDERKALRTLYDFSGRNSLEFTRLAGDDVT